MKQLTLKGEFSVHGKGLHSGVQVNATFKPAPENTGFIFKRIDLEGCPTIEALAENVVATNRGTVLGCKTHKDVKIGTIEHAMAALYAAGIDNCIIEVDGAELPILDGSAIEYSTKIEEVGLDKQNADKEFYVVKQRIKVVDEATGSSLIVLPDDDFSIDTMVEYDSNVLNNQFASLTSLSNFKDEIAGSRTFVFVREILVTWTMPSSSTTRRCPRKSSTRLPTWWVFSTPMPASWAISTTNPSPIPTSPPATSCLMCWATWRSLAGH